MSTPGKKPRALRECPGKRLSCDLTALIDALPNEGTIGIPTTIAADLVALLPRGGRLNVRSSGRPFAPAGPGQTQILMVLSAFAIMTLIVFAISAADPGGNRRESLGASRE